MHESSLTKTFCVFELFLRIKINVSFKTCALNPFSFAKYTVVQIMLRIKLDLMRKMRIEVLLFD